MDDIGRWRVGEHEDAEHADAEYDIHHRARAVAVGQLADIVAENTRRNDVDGGERARRGDIEAVHPYQVARQPKGKRDRSEEHTSELQSLMRNSYAVFSLQKKKYTKLRLTVANL